MHPAHGRSQQGPPSTTDTTLSVESATAIAMGAPESQVRSGLAAGGNRIRTAGPARAKGSSGQPFQDAGTANEAMEGQVRTAMVPRRPRRHRSVHGGTISSNPVSSSGESVSAVHFTAIG